MRKIMFLIAIMALFSLTIGCVWQETRVERDYGTSYQLQKYNQILNPEAEKNLAPVTGMDGRAAQGAVENYEKGFEKTAPTTTSYQINVGSMGGK
jgi:hypothetical protein